MTALIRSLLTQRAQVPKTIVYGSERATVLGMADLGEQQRRTHLSGGISEAEQETTSQPHCR